jgi:hypothetical protein
LHTPPADTCQDWVEKFGVDPDRVRGMESDDLAWLRAGEGEGHFHGPGAWPFGIERVLARAALRRERCVLPAFQHLRDEAVTARPRGTATG